MKRESAAELLQFRIITLQQELEKDELELKAAFKETLHGLKPGNLIKSSIKEIVKSPELKSNIINAVIGLATGFLARKLIVGRSHNPIKKLVGKLAEVSVANKVGSNADGIRSIGSLLFKKFFHKSGNNA